MKNALFICMLLCAAPAGAQQGSQECTVLVAKEWIAMGATTLNGCLNFADEAATPGERQFAKFGGIHLKVQGEDHFQSTDGGNTWEPVIAQSADAGFGSLNVLQAPERTVERPAEASPSRAPVKKKKRRRRRA